MNLPERYAIMDAIDAASSKVEEARWMLRLHPSVPPTVAEAMGRIKNELEQAWQEVDCAPSCAKEGLPCQSGE
jgi:hypothetical protein